MKSPGASLFWRLTRELGSAREAGLLLLESSSVFGPYPYPYPSQFMNFNSSIKHSEIDGRIWSNFYKIDADWPLRPLKNLSTRFGSGPERGHPMGGSNLSGKSEIWLRELGGKPKRLSWSFLRPSHISWERGRWRGICWLKKGEAGASYSGRSDCSRKDRCASTSRSSP